MYTLRLTLIMGARQLPSLFWREVLEALNSMPRSLRDTSRVFRHHIAISRRRIATLNEEFYGVKSEEKIAPSESGNRGHQLRTVLPSNTCQLQSENVICTIHLRMPTSTSLKPRRSVRGSPRERVMELRRLANEATRKAYERTPTSPSVIETYVKNLLGDARESPEAGG